MNHCLNEAQEFEREYYDAIEDYEITGEKYSDPEFNISASFSPQVRPNRLRTVLVCRPLPIIREFRFLAYTREWKVCQPRAGNFCNQTR